MRAGDIVTVDFGIPHGSEPGFARPAVIVTADLVLQSSPRTLHVVPLTSNVTRRLPTEVEIGEVDLPLRSAAQAHLCGVVSVTRLRDVGGSAPNVGHAALAQIRSIIADLLDCP
jgi:mRNA interferase MazF